VSGFENHSNIDPASGGADMQGEGGHSPVGLEGRHPAGWGPTWLEWGSRDLLIDLYEAPLWDVAPHGSVLLSGHYPTVAPQERLFGFLGWSGLL